MHVRENKIVTPKSLSDVISDMWQARFWIFLGGALGVLCASVFIFSATPYFRSQIMISPANSMSNAEEALSSTGGEVAAVRLFMQRMGGVTSSFEFTRFEYVYDGPRVAKILLRNPKILAGLAIDKSFSFVPSMAFDDAAVLSEYIARRVRLESVGQTSLRRLVYLHPNADFGRYFLHELHKITDGLIRRSVLEQTGQRISHLRQEIEGTGNPEHRRVLTNLLMEQERLKMLAAVDSAYAASVIEPPASSAKPVWPSVPLVYLAFVMVGALVGFISCNVVQQTVVDRRKQGGVTAKRWFRSEGSNANMRRRPLTQADSFDERDRA